jgi:hypothetical protein
MSQIYFKGRDGRSVTIQPVGLSPNTLSKPDFGMSTSPAGLRKLALATLAKARNAKRVSKMRKAMNDARVGDSLRHQIIGYAVRVSKQAYDPQPPGGRGGTSLVKERNAIVADVMGREDLPAKLQARLVQLVMDAAPITIVSSATAWEGAQPYPPDKPYPGYERR